VLGGGGGGAQYYDEIFIALEGLRFGEKFEVNFWKGLREKHAVQSGFWVPSQYLLYDGGKPR
jgi:hypothetical protein